MEDKVIFLRKKSNGENSIEEFAYRIAEATGAIVKVCPCYSTTLKGMLLNIKFARKEQGKVNHIVAQTESYLVPFLKGKSIVTFHDLGTLYSSRNFLYKVLKILIYLKCAEFFSDAITFVSNQTMNEFFKQKWKKKLNLNVIYNSYDNRLIPNDVSDIEIKPIVLQIGTGSRKNLESTIRAMVDIDAKLLVVGKLTENQITLLKECNINFENYVDISYEKIIECYNRAMIIAFPTFYEGFGLPVIEANVMRKPIISSDLPIIHEVGGDSVLYINPNDVHSISEAFKNLLSEKEVYDKFVKNGIENAKRFSSETIYKQYQALYKSLENGQYYSP